MYEPNIILINLISLMFYYAKPQFSSLSGKMNIIALIRNMYDTSLYAFIPGNIHHLRQSGRERNCHSKCHPN